MSKLFAAAGLAATIITLAVAPAQAQQQGKPDKDGQCPPGQNANGPYCETKGPVKNCPPGTQPQGVYCESVGNRGGNSSPRTIAGSSAADIAAFKQGAAGQLLRDVNVVLKRNGLAALAANRILVTNTNTGFVATVLRLSANSTALTAGSGLPVAVIGCAVSACPTGYNVRVDFSRRTLSAAATSRRLYLPPRKLSLRSGETAKIVAKFPRTAAARRKAADARSLAIRITARTRDTPNGVVVSRTVKTVKVGLTK